MAEFTAELGMETARAEDGVCVIELTLDERHMSTARRAHGGVLFTMLDTALGRAVISRLPEGRGCATVEAKVNYFRPVQSDKVQPRLTAHVFPDDGPGLNAKLRCLFHDSLVDLDQLGGVIDNAVFGVSNMPLTG